MGAIAGVAGEANSQSEIAAGIVVQAEIGGPLAEIAVEAVGSGIHSEEVAETVEGGYRHGPSD